MSKRIMTLKIEQAENGIVVTQDEYGYMEGRPIRQYVAKDMVEVQRIVVVALAEAGGYVQEQRAVDAATVEK